MSEEVKIKISQTMFEVGELERFDNNIHNIIEEYSKLMFKEKDQILTQRIIMKQEEEIERLNKENTILKQTMSNNSLLINENAFLKERIDKAIEFIENDLSHATSNGKLHRKHLLDILKGSDKE